MNGLHETRGTSMCPLKRVKTTVGIVVADLEATIAFFIELRMELEGKAPVEILGGSVSSGSTTPESKSPRTARTTRADEAHAPTAVSGPSSSLASTTQFSTHHLRVVRPTSVRLARERFRTPISCSGWTGSSCRRAHPGACPWDGSHRTARGVEV